MRVVIELQGSVHGINASGLSAFGASVLQSFASLGQYADIRVVLLEMPPERLRVLRGLLKEYLSPDCIFAWPPLANNETLEGEQVSLLYKAFLATLEPEIVISVSSPHESVSLDALSWFQIKIDAGVRQRYFFLSDAARQLAVRSAFVNEKDARVLPPMAWSVLSHAGDLAPAEERLRALLLGVENQFILVHLQSGREERWLRGELAGRLQEVFATLPNDVRLQHQLVFVGGACSGLRSEDILVFTDLGVSPGRMLVLPNLTIDVVQSLYGQCSIFLVCGQDDESRLAAYAAHARGAIVVWLGASQNEALPQEYCTMDALASDLMQAATALSREAKKTDSPQNSAEPIDAFAFPSNPNLYPVLAPVAERILARLRGEEADAFLYVDISELVNRDARTGIQRVVRSILLELLNCPPEGYQVVPVYAKTDVLGYRSAKRFVAQLRGETLPAREDPFIAPMAGDIFLGLDLQHFVVLFQQPVLQAMQAHGVRMAFVVYDLLPVLMAKAFPPKVDQLHASWLRVLALMDDVVCISKSVADEFENWLRQYRAPVSSLRLSWFHMGADIEGSLPSTGLPAEAGTILNRIQQRPSFLHVGTVEPRKGLTQVLDAFEEVWREGIDVNLVLIGKAGWQVSELVERLSNHPELDRRLFWLQGISDEYLELVYAGCSCLVAASLGEGFGLPLIEAARRGLPIIARDIAVFREVAGEHATYFSGAQAENLRTILLSWLDAYRLGTHRRSEGISWQTWRQSAQQLMQLLVNPSSAHQWTVQVHPDVPVVGLSPQGVAALVEQVRQQVLRSLTPNSFPEQIQMGNSRDLADANARIDALLHSSSWRITQPLRRFTEVLHHKKPLGLKSALVWFVATVLHKLRTQDRLGRRINGVLERSSRLSSWVRFYEQKISSLSSADGLTGPAPSAVVDCRSEDLSTYAQKIYRDLKLSAKQGMS